MVSLTGARGPKSAADLMWFCICDRYFIQPICTPTRSQLMSGLYHAGGDGVVRADRRRRDGLEWTDRIEMPEPDPNLEQQNMDCHSICWP